jgi:hypothetical protein
MSYDTKIMYQYQVFIMRYKVSDICYPLGKERVLTFRHFGCRNEDRKYLFFSLTMASVRKISKQKSCKTINKKQVFNFRRSLSTSFPILIIALRCYDWQRLTTERNDKRPATHNCFSPRQSHYL